MYSFPRTCHRHCCIRLCSPSYVLDTLEISTCPPLFAIALFVLLGVGKNRHCPYLVDPNSAFYRFLKSNLLPLSLIYPSFSSS